MDKEKLLKELISLNEKGQLDYDNIEKLLDTFKPSEYANVTYQTETKGSGGYLYCDIYNNIFDWAWMFSGDMNKIFDNIISKIKDYVIDTGDEEMRNFVKDLTLETIEDEEVEIGNFGEYPIGSAFQICILDSRYNSFEEENTLKETTEQYIENVDESLKETALDEIDNLLIYFDENDSQEDLLNDILDTINNIYVVENYELENNDNERKIPEVTVSYEPFEEDIKKGMIDALIKVNPRIKTLLDQHYI